MQYSSQIKNLEDEDKNVQAVRFRISLRVSLLFVFIIWLVKIIEIIFGVRFVEYGVFPQTFSGLKGILFSPFIHGDFKHLFSNTFPVLFLFMGLIYFYPRTKFQIFGIIYFASGVILWIIGRQSYHIGASGLIYALAAFHFFSGVLSKRTDFIALSLIVIFLYGGLVWGIFPGGEERVSWEGHLAGFVVGAFLSVFYHPKPKIELYSDELDDKINFVYFYDFKNHNASIEEHIYYKYFDEEETDENEDNIKIINQ